MNSSPTPLVPLRWYEHALLRFLARSPRIHAVYVVQDAAPPAEPAPQAPIPPPQPPQPAGRRTPTLDPRVNYLESLLRLPPPPESDTRHG